MLKISGRQPVFLEGDKDTMGVLTDGRLRGAEIEVVGSYLSGERFQVGPIHKKSVSVHKEGNKYGVSYWCAVCAIRTYSPGICQCCQEETALELQAVDTN